jgi:EmrB/QacA subfamily drug resistance transporter
MEPESTGTNRALTVIALLSALFMAAMEMTVVSTAMPTVIGDLGGIRLYSWVFTAYMLTATVTVPMYGKLADLYGRKPILLLGVVLFMVGSVASGASQSIYQLIGFRALQGLGAGAVQPVTMTVVGDLFDVEERAKMQGLFGAVWGLAGITGPLLGGTIVKLLSWRWVFYINVPFGVACILILSLAFHERVEKKRRVLDLAGAALLAGAVVALLVGSSGGALGIALIALSGVLCAFFFGVERRASEPMLPLPLFRRRVMWVATALGTLLGAVMIAATTFVPLDVQAVLGGTATEAGSAIAPMVIGWPIASALSGRILVKIGFRPLIWAGLGVAACATTGLAYSVVSHAAVGMTRASMALLGVGLGLANTALVIAVQTSVEWRERGVATASTMFFRTIGGTLAVGALGAVVARHLGGMPGIPSDAANRLLGPTHGHDLAPEVAHALGNALSSGLHTVFWVIAAIALLGFLTGLAFPSLPVKLRADEEIRAKPADVDVASEA